MYSGITSGRVLDGELLYTKILEVNLFAFVYRLFHEDFSSIDVPSTGLFCKDYSLFCRSHQQRNSIIVTHNDTQHTYTSLTISQTISNMLDCPENRDAKSKSYGHRAFGFAGADMWNTLPLDKKLSSSVSVFKTKLKTHLFKQCYGSTN